MDLFHGIYVAWRQYRAFYATLARLQRMSDAELARIGAGRGDITRLAFETAERSVDERTGDRPTASSSGRGGLAVSAG